MNNVQFEDLVYQLAEYYRLGQLKSLKKSKIDYDQLLETVPIEEIERYLRKIKLQNIESNFYL